MIENEYAKDFLSLKSLGNDASLLVKELSNDHFFFSLTKPAILSSNMKKLTFKDRLWCIWDLITKGYCGYEGFVLDYEQIAILYDWVTLHIKEASEEDTH